MTLKREVQVKVEGKYVKGSVIEGCFKTNTLIHIDARNYPHGFSSEIIRNIIEELQELADIIDASEVTEELAKESRIDDDIW